MIETGVAISESATVNLTSGSKVQRLWLLGVLPKWEGRYDVKYKHDLLKASMLSGFQMDAQTNATA